jgi:hypothetical protein
LDYICGLIPARIRRALAELPETLDETYERTLRQIKKGQWEIAHRLFQFVTVASRPLRVKELAELLAFDFEAGPIPKFHEDWRLEDPVEAVLSTCSSLLAIVEGGYRFGKFIQFSHFSVKEFLVSTRLAETSDIIPRRYHISMTPAHTLAARVCFGILFHLDKDVVTRDNFKEYPLAEYAAEHWADHALLEDVLQNVEDGMKQLFDPRKPHFAVWIWIRDPGLPSWEPIRRIKKPLRPRRTPLHYAALRGLYSMVEFLVVKHAQDVNSRGLTDNAIPLHLASERGHVKVVRFLLERGAKVTAQTGEGRTPLHLVSKRGQLEVIGILIERGADVSAHDNHQQTPLHLAVFYGHVEVAVILIGRGADVSAQDKFGSTSLHLVSEQGQLEVVGMLIEHGADVTARNDRGCTPLHLASENGQREVACVLIEHGATVTARDNSRLTQSHLAEFVTLQVLQHADLGADPGTGENMNLIQFLEVRRTWGTTPSNVVTVNPRGWGADVAGM